MFSEHKVTIASDKFVEVDQDLIPTGNILSVDDTFMDLRKPAVLADILPKCPGGDFAGFSHCFVINDNLTSKDESSLKLSDKALVDVATVEDKTTGRGLRCLTDQPGLIFYTGQYNSSTGPMVGRSGKVYGKYSGLCLETQKFGDSCNHPNFPSWTLHPGQVYTHNTEYMFYTF